MLQRGGVVNPYIYVTSELVEKLPSELIASVLAHECGHIASKHYLYHSIALQILGGVKKSPLVLIPGVKRILTPPLVKAFLFWQRCSELSADRAAVLCDGNDKNTIDVLLRINGYDDQKIDREEFIKQAIDLNDFVNDSNVNKIIEQMLVNKKSHPRLATRVYECYNWAKSKQFEELLNGTYSIPEPSIETKEVINGELKTDINENLENKQDISINIDEALTKVNEQLDKYTSNANAADYAISVAAGIFGGIIDSVFIGETIVTNNEISLSHENVNRFIQGYAEVRGYGKERLKDAIAELEKAFPVLQDNIWKDKHISRVTPKNHHLADLAHHPTLLGLLSAVIVHFLRIGTFINREGKWKFVFVETTKEDIIQVAIPALISAILNWLVSANEKNYEEETGKKIPESIHKILHVASSTPLIIEIAKCADNWFGHLVSDMGGSKNTAGGGMGIPGIFISLLHEMSGLPILKDSNLPEIVNNLYQENKINLRRELAVIDAAKKQLIPLVFVEIYTRLAYFVSRLAQQVYLTNKLGKSFKEIDFKRVIPFGNRTIDRMILIANMTFNIADTADAAVHAAIESDADAILFAGKFVMRYNYIGAGRTALAIVKEISSERKETQLIHQKLILTEIKTKQVVEQIEAYKSWLEEKYTTFIAEDIQEFMNGFDYIKQGIESNDSNLTIKGNVVIQEVLGRKPQFTNQKEFDDLMKSDTALVL